jgi:transposase
VVTGLKHQKEKRSMDHFAGQDVSVKETSICIVDDTGKIVREVKVASEPDALLQVLKNSGYRFKRIGMEAGPLSQWLYSAFAEANLPVICVETRHRADDAGGTVSSSACEDITQSEAAHVADPSQAAAVEGHRHRE